MKTNDKIIALISESENYKFSNNNYSTNTGIYSRPGIAMQSWIAECEDLIITNYGKDSAPWRVFERFDNNELEGNYEDTFEKQKDKIVSALIVCLRIPPKSEKSVSSSKISLNLSQVFIVHGRDEVVKIKVARFIEKLGLEPIILHEKPSSGNTIIEKIEEHSNIGFGIVLYTPCDIGGIYSDTPVLKSRARQNVVFEHGFLIGKIGRENVCALVKGTIETPNDISGVVYVPMDDTDAWQIQIAKELKKSGYPVDMNKII